MYPTFQGSISAGKLMIPELDRRMKFLEGKPVAVVALDTNSKDQIMGGQLVAGVYSDQELKTVEGKQDLRAHEGRRVMVIVQQDLVNTVSVSKEDFDSRYQLGARSGDLDT